MRRARLTSTPPRSRCSARGSAPRITVEQLFAYTFGVLAGTDYTERFHEALETPGPRVPLTADPDLFARMVAHGEKLIWLQTFGERFGKGKLPTDGINVEGRALPPP